MAEEDLLERAKREIASAWRSSTRWWRSATASVPPLRPSKPGEGQKRASRRASRQRGRPTTFAPRRTGGATDPARKPGRLGRAV